MKCTNLFIGIWDVAQHLYSATSLFRNNSTICAFSFTGTDIVTYYFIIFITLISLGLSRATGGLLM
jgi:hypothetical protein